MERLPRGSHRCLGRCLPRATLHTLLEPQTHTGNPHIKPMVPHLQASGTVLGTGQGHNLAGEADGRDFSGVPSLTRLLHSPPAPAQHRPTLEPSSDFPLLWDRDLPPALQTVLAPAALSKGQFSLPHSWAWRAWAQASSLLLTVPPVKFTNPHVLSLTPSCGSCLPGPEGSSP